MQTRFLDWLGDGWHEADCHAAQMPVGSGKSAAAVAISKALPGVHVITPSNILIDQYRADYPKHNYLKGKAHYACISGMACSDWIDTLEQPACDTCPYKRCKERAVTESTFFNPMSLYYFLMRGDAPKVLVVDEAHQLASMVMMLCAKKFRKSMYNWDAKCLSEVHLVRWMDEQMRKLQKLASLYQETRAHKKLAEITSEIESFTLVRAGLADDAGNFAVYTEDGKYRGKPEKYLVVRPVRPPRIVVRQMLNSGKIVLLSGTLLPTDIEDLSVDRTVRFIDLPSPIPKERRPILYRPAPFPMNYKTDPSLIAALIERTLAEFPGQNAIVHVSYAMSEKLAPHFTRPILRNTSATKMEVVERFKRDGGVFLAAGCAEGLDLKDDFARLNIIPQLMFPNLGDVVVQKRKAQDGGEKWYALETLKTSIQQAGRTTRNESDWSNTVVLDPNFSRLVNKRSADLPQSFTEAISWDGKGVFRG